MRAMAAVTRVMNTLDKMFCSVSSDVPDTVAALRVASIELGDCVSEFSSIGSDIGRGVRETAGQVHQTRRAVVDAAYGTREVVQRTVVPAVAAATPKLQSAAEAALKERSSLPDSL